MRRTTALRMFLPALCLLPALLWALPPTSWETRGPGGGGAMYSPTFNPAQRDELYVGCDMSPQFHTTDLGVHWQTLDFRQVQGGHNSAVRFTRDPLVRWTLDYSPQDGGDCARPKKSTDGGKTWQLLSAAAWPSDRQAYVLYADYDHPERAFVTAEYTELWATLDGGKTFEKKITAASDNGLHFAGSYFDDDTIYAGMGEGVYRSTNGGATFAMAGYTGIPAGEFIVSFAGAKTGGKVRLYAVTAASGWADVGGEEHNSYKGVYVLDVGATQWVKKTTGIPSGVHPWFVGTSSANINTAYVGGGSDMGAPTVYKTTDGGAHWTDVFQTAANKNIITGWAGVGADFGWSFPEYALGFDVCHSDPNRVVITDLSCLHLTTDGGATWREAYTTLPAPGIIGNVHTKGTLFASCGLEVTSCWRVVWFTPQTLMACLTDIRGARSTDGGATWSFGYTGHSLNTMYDTCKSETLKTCYAATSGVHDLYQSTYLTESRIINGKGRVLFSTDDGANWQTLKDFSQPIVSVALDPGNPHRLYACEANTASGGINVTDDLEKGAQATWRELPSPPRTEGHAYDLIVLKDGTIVCTYSGRRAATGFTPSSGVFVSTDAGQTWIDRSAPGMRFWTKDIVVDSNDATQQTWYASVFFAWGASASSGVSGLYRTRDRGKTWTLLAGSAIAPSGVLNVESCAFNPANPDECYFTTEYDGLWVSENARADKPTFTQVASYPFKHPLRVYFNPSAPTEMWVTSFGNGMSVGTMMGK